MKAQKGEGVRITTPCKNITNGKTYKVIGQSTLSGMDIVVINDIGCQHHFSGQSYEVVEVAGFKWGDPVAVRDSDHEDWTQAIYVGEDPVDGGYIVMVKKEPGIYDPVWFDQCKLRTTVTKQEIADWKNVPVELLNIES